MQTEVLKIDQVVDLDKNQTRTNPKSQALKELADSIRQMGVLQPILVTEHDKGTVKVIAGRRRLAAAKMAGLPAIPVIRIVASEQLTSEISVIENLQRENLPPLEEASEIQKLLKRGWDTKEIADHLGKSPTWVIRRAALTRLCDSWQKALTDPRHPNHEAVTRWPAGHLELVARIPREAQVGILGDCWDVIDRDTLEKLCNQETQLLSQAPWKKDDGTLAPDVGPCTECTQRSSHQPGLFDDWGIEPEELKKTDRCLDPTCWEKKAAAYVERKEAELKEKTGKEVIRVKDSWHSQVKDAVSQGEIKKLKKSAEDAQPCLVVDGPKAGQVFYGTKQSWASSSRSRSSGQKAGPKSLEERRDQLANRREALVNKWLREKLRDSYFAKVAVGRYSEESLLRHLATFGTGPMAPGPNAWTGKPEPKDKMLAKLWGSVFEVLEERLHFYGQPSVKEHEALCKEHGDLFNVTIEGLREKAAQEIPEPKSWANLNADGTPKKVSRGKK